MRENFSRNKEKVSKRIKNVLIIGGKGEKRQHQAQVTREHFSN